MVRQHIREAAEGVALDGPVTTMMSALRLLVTQAESEFE